MKHVEGLSQREIHRRTGAHRDTIRRAHAQPKPPSYGQSRRGYIVTCELPYSRAFAGALVFSKEFHDIASGMSRCLASLDALPSKLVWDREGAIAPRGRPTGDFLAFCGELTLGWVILD